MTAAAGGSPGLLWQPAKPLRYEPKICQTGNPFRFRLQGICPGCRRGIGISKSKISKSQIEICNYWHEQRRSGRYSGRPLRAFIINITLWSKKETPVQAPMLLQSIFAVRCLSEEQAQMQR